VPGNSAIGGSGGQALLASGNGGKGVSGYGGASNGTSSDPNAGGAGVYASGGNAAGPNDNGGKGLNAFGGNGNGNGDGGAGVTATGGAAGVGPGGIAGVSGDGIDAYAGSGGEGGYGIFAQATGNYAGYFDGGVEVDGFLTKSSGSFKIDHPLDPANKYLYHSFVESPDMKNVYDGIVVTDGSGTATVTMPAWFEALNSDFRYQLTTIGQPARAWIGSEIANHTFVVRTDRPNVKISWQVTGIRQDAWANAHRIQVEVDKAPGTRATTSIRKYSDMPVNPTSLKSVIPARNRSSDLGARAKRP